MSFMNDIRTITLLSVLTLIFLAVGFLFAGIAGMLIGLVFALGINFVSYWYSDSFVLRLYRAKPALEKDYPELYISLEKLSKKAAIPVPKLYIVNMDAPNAFATGRSPDKGAVAVTRGLLSHLNTEEIEAVIAHELGHIKNRDTLVSAMAATISGAMTWLAYLFFFGSSENRNIFSYLLLFILAPLAAMLIRMAISRSREFSADEFGGKISNPLHLASALEAINAAVKQKPMKGNNATSHMFIINPFSSGLAGLFSTHPPVNVRTARLRRMAI